MTLSRRSFFRLAAGAALLPVAPGLAFGAPLIVGDGIHDDTAGMQALFRGDPVEFADPAMAKGAGWLGNILQIPQGTFRITETIEYDGNHHAKHVVINGSGSEFLNEVKDGICVQFVNNGLMTFRDFKVTGKKSSIEIKGSWTC